MNKSNLHEQAAKETIESLIQVASNYDIQALTKIYHDDMQVIMVDPSGQAHTANKTEFTQMVQARMDEGVPMNTWAQFHHVQANAEKATVILSRKNNLAGEDMHLYLNIDLIYENERWQVIREVIFLRPDSA